jgi:hypothetical protein
MMEISGDSEESSGNKGVITGDENIGAPVEKTHTCKLSHSNVRMYLVIDL